MLRRLLLSLALLIPLPLQAATFRARPLSELRLLQRHFLNDFGGRDFGSLPLMASDGKDFLAAASTTARDGGGFPYSVAIQRVVQGNPAGSWQILASGLVRGVSWTGDHYLVAWAGEDGLRIAEVSRLGSVLRLPSEPVLSGAGSFASHGERSLALAESISGVITAQPLDAHGRKSGPAVQFNAGSGFLNSRLFAVADGYAATRFTYGQPHWMLLRNDVTLRAWVPISGMRDGLALTDGENTLLLYLRQGQTADELWGLVLAADGTIRNPARILGTASHYSRIAGAWDGSRYVVAAQAALPSGGADSQAHFLYVSPQGEASTAAVADLRYPQFITGLTLAGDDLLLMLSNWYGLLFPADLHAPPRTVRIWRTSAPQGSVDVAAGSHGYLAAWREESDGSMTVRASRIDASGKYLDDLVLTTLMAIPSAPAVAGDGENWLVAWGDRGTIRGVRISSKGTVLDSPPLTLGQGESVDVQWNGSKYIVVYGSSGLFSTNVTPTGIVGPTMTLEPPPGVNRLVFRHYLPALASAGDETMVAYERVQGICYLFGVIHCLYDTRYSVHSLLLDQDGGAAAGPLKLADGGIGRPAIATDGANYLVLWADEGRLFGALNGLSFPVASNAEKPSLTFDGGDYVAAWQSKAGTAMYTARLSPSGVPQRVIQIPADGEKIAADPAVAAHPSLPAVVAFTARNPEDQVPRAALLFVRDLDAPAAAPSKPVILGASAGGDEVFARWSPVNDALGVAIELLLDDGSYRTIGVAAAGATSATVPLEGLTGTGVRIRTWNLLGSSEPSSTLPFWPGKRRAVR